MSPRFSVIVLPFIEARFHLQHGIWRQHRLPKGRPAMIRHRMIAAMALAALSILPAYSQTTVLDQVPVPIPATTTGVGQSEFLLQSLSTGGITCYMAFYKPPGAPSQPFVQPGGLSCPQ